MDEEEIDFGVEAEGVIKDVEFTVQSICVSSKLPATKECVYLNLVTKENKVFCVELSVLGFRVSTKKLLWFSRKDNFQTLREFLVQWI